MTTSSSDRRILTSYLQGGYVKTVETWRVPRKVENLVPATSGGYVNLGNEFHSSRAICGWLLLTHPFYGQLDGSCTLT
jgi:hypothetical protein